MGNARNLPEGVEIAHASLIHLMLAVGLWSIGEFAETGSFAMVKMGAASAVVDLFPKDLLISIKPEYASAILEGRKTVELRRKFPEDVAFGSRLYIYSSSPIQAVVGIASVTRVDRL